MKVVPLADGSGTIPLRASKNPVLGVFRHHCGDIATVHAPKGKKAHLRYVLCDKCGCDQASGASYQEKIRKNSFNSIEELQAFEQSTGLVTEVTEDLTELLTESLTVTEQPKVEPETTIRIVEAVNNQLLDLPPITEPIAKLVTETVTVPVTENKPTINQQFDSKKPVVHPVRLGFAAVIGGIFGIALALAS